MGMEKDKKIDNGKLIVKENKNNKLPPEAQAPYNFIPLNDVVVESDFDIGKTTFDKYYPDRHTGYIDLETEAKTSIYIRDTNKDYRTTDKDKEVNSNFFSPADKYRIPGSSIRGLIRNITEIISFGKFNFFEKDRRFHFRTFMDKSIDLKDKYNSKMIKVKDSNSNKKIFSNASLQTGFLVKTEHDKFFIKPAFNEDHNCWFFRVEESDLVKKGIINNDKAMVVIDGKPVVSPNVELKRKSEKDSKPPGTNPEYKQDIIKIKFKPTDEAVYEHKFVKLKYAKVVDIKDFNDDTDDYIDGYLMCTGWVGGKPWGKHMYWIIGQASGDPIDVPLCVINEYKNDIDRGKESINLFEKLKEKLYREEGVPCFYITDDKGIVESIGHTGMFRLAYKYKLDDYIPYDLKDDKDNKKIDIPTAIFGNETNFSSRVFFEDIYLDKNSKNKITQEDVSPKILARPKPTSFQLYLEQTGNIKKREDGKKKLIGYSGIKDYNSDPKETKIRGYKLYWHKNGKNYFEPDNTGDNKHESQHTKIKPINEGAIFRGRVRFENLSDIELGALLTAIELKDGLCHKIGMGKPLGLGSVKIKVEKLHIFDMKKRYTDLFSDWEESKECNIDKSEYKKYIKSFEDYILKALGLKNEKQSIWDIDRLKALENMLNFKNQPEQNYMVIKKGKGKGIFKNRGILPPALSIKK